MSWLVNSIANSLNLDDNDDDDDDFHPLTTNSSAVTATAVAAGGTRPNHNNDEIDPRIHWRQMQFTSPCTSGGTAAPRGVKEDLSELSDTLSRQLWGVASFLAPPPQIFDLHAQSEDSDADCAAIRNESSEVEDEVPNYPEFGLLEELSVEDYNRRGVVGISEEVVTFARNIALHPETWIDFPLPDDDIDEDSDLSDAQQEHTLAVERLAPELAAIRIELCLSYMSEACFWKIYFALVHPRLSRHDAEILSTPEIVKARAMLSQELHSHGKQKPYEFSNSSADIIALSHEEHLSVPGAYQFDSVSNKISAVGPAFSAEVDVEIEKHAVVSTEIGVIDKRIVEEIPMKQTNIQKPRTIVSKIMDQKYEDDDEDDWLKEVNSEEDAFKGTYYPPGDYDDISFSDLEEEDDVPSSFIKVGNPNEKVSSNTLKTKESNDWLDIQDIDIA